MLCANRLSVPAPVLVLLLCCTALSPSTAHAAFGGRSIEAFFETMDFRDLDQSSEPVRSLNETTAAYRAALSPIEAQIRTLCGQIRDQLAGGGSVDTDHLAALAQQVFALRAQRDALDLTQMVTIHSVLSPAAFAQLVQVTARDAEFNELIEHLQAQAHPTREPRVAYLPDSLFGDRLGYTRGLALTAEQSATMSAIMDANQSAFTAIQRQRTAVRDQIRARLTGPAPVTVVRLRPLQRRASVLEDQLDQRQLTMTLQLRALLTPAQLAQAALLHQRQIEPKRATTVLPNRN